MLKKALSLLLALLMITAVFVGCGKKKADVGGDSDDNAQATTAQTTVETTAETKDFDFGVNADVTVNDTSIYDDMTIPDLLDPENFQGSDIPEDRDYGGYKFKILADTTNVNYEFIEESDGELISDAVINRQTHIEEYVGIDFVLTELLGGYNHMDDYSGEIEAASGAGTPYDMGLAYNLIPPVVASKGLSKDLAESENLNLKNTTKEYWGKEIKKEIMVGGRIFWMSDNSSWNNIRNMLCIFVNTEYFTKNNPTMDKSDLYNMVYNGVWTFDNMFNLIQNAYENVNMGTSATDGADNGDMFGLQAASHYAWLDTWLYAAGFRYTELNSNGTYDWTLGNQPVIDFIDWWQEKLKDDDIDKTDSDVYQQFLDGRAMFALSSITMVEQKPEIDFTVLPMPLYKTSVKSGYSTPFANTYSSWLIPKATNFEAFERSATVLELLAAEGNRRLAPVYFEIYLKRQTAANDEDMRKMFNIIRNCIVFDMGYLYGSVLTYDMNGSNKGEVFLAVRRIWSGTLTGNSLGHENISTVWASIGQSVTIKLNKLMVDILEY